MTLSNVILNITPFIGAVFAAIVSFFTNRFLIGRATAFRLMDEPNHRSSHSTPTPRGGGLGILLGFSIGMILFSLLLPPITLVCVALVLGWLLAGMGLYDDMISASSLSRLAMQAIAVILLLFTFHYLSAHRLPYSSLIHYLVIGLAVFAGIWLMNLYNFMDGINGIAAMEAIFVLLAAITLLRFQGIHSAVAPVMLILSGACAGFLCWNFPRAKIFMGDTGSLFLGFMLFFFAIYTVINRELPMIVWLMWLSVFWVDTTYTLLMRLATKQAWYSPHRSHLYQILSQRLQSHTKVVLFILVYNVFWLFPLSVIALQWPQLKFFYLFLSITPVLIMDICLGAGRHT